MAPPLAASRLPRAPDTDFRAPGFGRLTRDDGPVALPLAVRFSSGRCFRAWAAADAHEDGAGEGGGRRLGRLERAAGVFVLRQHRLPAEGEARARAMASSVQRLHLQRLAGVRAAVPVVDLGQFRGPAGRPCLWSAAPLLPAGSLADMLAVGGAAASPRASAMAVRVLEDGSAALVALEQQGIAHNDVRPEHLLFDGRRFVLSGFGEAAATAPGERSPGWRGDGPRPPWLPARSPHEPGHRGRFVAPELFAPWVEVTAVPFAFDAFCLAATALEAARFDSDFPYRALRRLPGPDAGCPLDLFGLVVHALWVERRLHEQTPADAYAFPEAIRMVRRLPAQASAAPPLATSSEAARWQARRRAEGRRQVEGQRAFWREAAGRDDGWLAWHLFSAVLAPAPAARQTASELHAFARAASGGVEPEQRAALERDLTARHLRPLASASGSAHGPWRQWQACASAGPT